MKFYNKKHFKYLIYIIGIILFLFLILCSYNGYFFFVPGFNEIDILFINIIGDAFLVGIATYITSKKISLYISKKEFDRNNKINITINESRNKIINYKDFMNIYRNNNSFFSIDKDEKELVDYVYNFYDYILNTLSCNDLEKQILDVMLNIPFQFKNYEDTDIKKSYQEIIENFDLNKQFNNINIFKQLLTNEDINKLKKFSKFISDFKHYIITNLNNNEGCQILILKDNIVSCKIPCLPNHTYDIYIYYKKECSIDILAFSFDYDAKEYAKNIGGFKYSNDNKKFKPIQINLKDYINIK